MVGVSATGRALWFILDKECWSNQITHVGRIACPAANFQTPDLLGRLDLKEILFTDQFLRLGSGFDEVRDGDADQQYEDCNYDQNFHKGKARPWISLEPGNFHKVLKRFVFLAKTGLRLSVASLLARRTSLRSRSWSRSRRRRQRVKRGSTERASRIRADRSIGVSAVRRADRRRLTLQVFVH